MPSRPPAAPEALNRFWKRDLHKAATQLPFPKTPTVSPSSALTVLRFFIDLCGPDGSMKYSTGLATICARTLLSRSTVVRCATYLETLGYLRRVRVGGGGVRKTHYEVEVKTILAQVATPAAAKGSPQSAPKPTITRRPWAGNRTTVGRQPDHREQAGSVNPGHLDSLDQFSLPPGTLAAIAAFDCGHGLDVRCRRTSAGTSSCVQCRAAERAATKPQDSPTAPNSAERDLVGAMAA